ncbi:MAG: DEAD/DEAH box helicase family protein [Ignavibacteriae bacterium]|nr:DEAD/DEAH box helicase family protein [Ignavibacteriota bacterium]
MAAWLAHSAGKNPPVPPQLYSTHVSNVLSRAMENIECLSHYYKGILNYFREAVRAAAIYHDLGKLDEDNQIVLLHGGGKGLPINHVDAGTANLLENDLVESALIAYAHHIGLQAIPEEQAKAELFLRDPNLFIRTKQYLTEYISRHIQSGSEKLAINADSVSDWNGLTRRLALSCLVDADHGDTASNYQKEFPVSHPDTRWKERLDALNNYIKSLSEKLEHQDERNKLRQQIYQACREVDTTPSFYACDSPVGTGKTTAVMAHLLQAAIDKNLRHIIVVLPYTNIIKQSVEVYRKGLVLPDENPDEVVAEHHHQADFDDINTRQLATLWKAPIIVTTAVQFFETIASNHPSKLRKLHELPGSGVFIDETHAAIPFHLWPQTWKWLKEFSAKWNCHFVFASGSLSRFWELKDMVDEPEIIPDLVSKQLREEALRQERKRIIPVRHPTVLNDKELIDLVLSKSGPRLVIMNTIQSAAVLADKLAQKIDDKEKYTIDLHTSKILHLSTALSPADREGIVKETEERLALPIDNPRRDFTLVATSCVEAGVDFSFRSAFRERAGAANLIQVGGRVRRNNEDYEPTLIDFRIDAPLFNRHPAFTSSSQILEKLFDEGKIETDAPANLVTEALRRELMSDTGERHKRLQKMETEMDYPEVAKLYKVISNNTILVLVGEETIKKLNNYKKGEKINPKEINRNSVQIWTDKISKTCAYQLEGFPGLYALDKNNYDKIFLGYMKGMLRLLQIDSEGGAVI